jgi:uncharacterized membrane protein
MSDVGSTQEAPKASRHAVHEGAPPASLRRREPARLPAVPARHPALVPLALAQAALVFAWCWARHQHFGSSSFDLGAYHSILWNVAFRGTPWNSIERAHQWSTHLEIGLAPLVPLYRVYPTPAWLWLCESVTCAAAVIPIDALARRITGDAVLGLVAAAAFLVAPQLVLGQLGDFQPLALSVLPIAVIAWAIEVDSSRGIALGSLAALLLREQLGFVVAIAAGLWVLRQGRRRAPPAAVLAVLAAGISLLEIFVLLPSIGSGSTAHYAAQYGGLGTGAEGAVRTAVARPLDLLAAAFEGPRRTYVLEVVSGALPLVLLSLRSLRKSAWPILLAAPPLAVQLLSAAPRKWDVHFGYGIPLLAAIAATSVLALRWLRPAPPEGGAPRLGERRLVALLWLALSAIHLAIALPSPVGPGRPIDPALAGSPRAAAIAKALALVPADASISAQDDLVPHVAMRSEVHRWPDGENTDDLVLLDVDGPAPNVRSREVLAAAEGELRASPEFEILVDEAGVLLAKRR